MKKLISLLLVAIMVCSSLVSCGSYDFMQMLGNIIPGEIEQPDDKAEVPEDDDSTEEESKNGNTDNGANDYEENVDVVDSLDDILILEGKSGEGEMLAELLGEYYDVTVYSFRDDLDKIPTGLVQLSDYEQIVLVNVAYSDMPENFDYTLHKYVNDLGGGLFTVGGSLDDGDTPHAYNKEDISYSGYLKKMLPIEALNYEPSVALMIVVDTSGSMGMGKLAAIKPNLDACFDVLNGRDYCGVMSLATTATEISEILPVTERDRIREAIRNNISDDPLDATGGTNFFDAIKKAGEALSKIDNVDKKHILIFTDGNPGDTYEMYSPYIEENYSNGITMSIITIERPDVMPTERDTLQLAVNLGGGVLYDIDYGETKEISRIIVEDLVALTKTGTYFNAPFVPNATESASVLDGVDVASIPELYGFFSSTVKSGANVSLMGVHDPIYVDWQYGEGRVGSFMCDLSGIWSMDFMSDEIGREIIFNIIRSLIAREKLL